MSALPGDTVVLGPAFEVGGVGQPDQVDDHAAVRAGERAAHLGVPRRDDARLGVLDHLSGGLGQQLLEMGQVLLDVLPVGAGEARQVDRGVVDAEVVPLADQTLGQLDERALAKLVGAGLEGEAEQPDPPASVRRQQLVGAAEMGFVRPAGRSRGSARRRAIPWPGARARGGPWAGTSRRSRSPASGRPR